MLLCLHSHVHRCDRSRVNLSCSCTFQDSRTLCRQPLLRARCWCPFHRRCETQVPTSPCTPSLLRGVRSFPKPQACSPPLSRTLLPFCRLSCLPIPTEPATHLHIKNARTHEQHMQANLHASKQHSICISCVSTGPLTLPPRDVCAKRSEQV